MVTLQIHPARRGYGDNAAKPTQLGQTAIALVELAALWIAKAVARTFFLEAQKICPFLEKMNVGAF